jgi:hypothetical protein
VAPAVQTIDAEGLPVLQKFTYVVALVDVSPTSVSELEGEHISFQHTVVTAKDVDEAYAKGLAWAARQMPLQHFVNDYVIPAQVAHDAV